MVHYYLIYIGEPYSIKIHNQIRPKMTIIIISHLLGANIFNYQNKSRN